jgi:hypothetical protein
LKDKGRTLKVVLYNGGPNKNKCIIYEWTVNKVYPNCTGAGWWKLIGIDKKDNWVKRA